MITFYPSINDIIFNVIMINKYFILYLFFLSIDFITIFIDTLQKSNYINFYLNRKKFLKLIKIEKTCIDKHNENFFERTASICDTLNKMKESIISNESHNHSEELHIIHNNIYLICDRLKKFIEIYSNPNLKNYSEWNALISGDHFYNDSVKQAHNDYKIIANERYEEL
jgi:hypothetical protein